MSLRWSGGQLDSAEVRSDGDQPCVIRYRERTVELKATTGQV
jgi:hypothetical protein